MAIEKMEVDVATCDACGAVQYLLEKDIPDGWYSGEATWVDEGAGETGIWHACRAAHIKKAVMIATQTIEADEVG